MGEGPRAQSARGSSPWEGGGDRARAARHLRAGAVAFKSGDFEGALVQFKVADRVARASGALWYLGASLVKLSRFEEAIEAFELASLETPESADALLRYYWGLACHGGGLFACAAREMKAVGDEAGPRVHAQAEKVSGEIERVLRGGIGRKSIDVLLERGEVALREGRPALAAAYFSEVLALGERSGGLGCDDAKRGIERADVASRRVVE